MAKNDKFNNFHIIDNTSGELMEEKRDVIKSILEQEDRERISMAFKRYSDKKNLSFDDMDLICKIKGIKRKVMLDLNRNDTKYITLAEHKQFYKSLESSCAHFIIQSMFYVTHEGFIVNDNNRLIENFTELVDFLGICSLSTFNKKIKKVILENKIIKCEKIEGKNFMVFNPIFAFRNRQISSYIFLCFSDELKAYLSDIEYTYLCCKNGIFPEQK